MDFLKFRNVNEENGAGDEGTPSLVAKYKNATPGQTSSAPSRQPARKGDKLNTKMDYSSKVKQDDIEVKSSMKEDTEEIDELKVSTLTRYGTKATQALGRNSEKDEKRIKGIQTARAKVQQKRKMKEAFEDPEAQKSEMALTKLYFIKYAAEEIMDYIEMGAPIEEWYQIKLAKVHADMEGLHSYMEGEKRRTGMVGEAASPMIAPPKTGKEFGTKADAFAYVKKHGGKVMKKSFINPRTGQKFISYVIKENAIDEAMKPYVSGTAPKSGEKGSYDVMDKDGKVVKSYPYTKGGMQMAQSHVKKLMKEGVMKNLKRQLTARDADSRAGEEAGKMMKAQQAGDTEAASKYNKRFKKLSALTKKEEYKSDAQRKAVWASKNEKGIKEKLDPSMGAGEYVKDFQKSDAPQFKGKNKKERQKMAVAAYLGAKDKGD